MCMFLIQIINIDKMILLGLILSDLLIDQTPCQVEALSKGKVEFDTPFRELGFFGVPFRSSCMLQPTTHCLINVIECKFHSCYMSPGVTSCHVV